MKKIFIVACICGMVGIVQANDAIPIINTVFHGINTLTNLFRPTVVTTVPVVTTPAPVVVANPPPPPPPPVVVTQPVVQTPVVYVNDPYVYQRPYVYRPAPPPPPPKPHHGGHRGGHRPPPRGRR